MYTLNVSVTIIFTNHLNSFLGDNLNTNSYRYILEVQKDISIVSTMTLQLIDPHTCNSNFQWVNLQKYDDTFNNTKKVSTKEYFD